MEIHWNRIIAFIMLLIVGLLLLHHWPQIRGLFLSVRSDGPSYSEGDPTLGFMVWGLAAILIVAIVKILAQGGGGGR